MRIIWTWIRDASRIQRSGVICMTTILSLILAITNASAAQEDDAIWRRAPRPRYVASVEEACDSVVSIQGEKQYEVGKRAFGRDAEYDVFNGMGTGVIIDPRGYIVTNYHVVKGLLKLEVITNDGERYRDVELIRNDAATDLAILKIKPKKPLKKIRLGRTERIRLVEDVFAIGNPYGYNCSVSKGIVSAINRPLEVNENLSYDGVIQTDAAINPGNSGGPLINIDGEMIGLNAAVREEAENIAFAIPVDVVESVAERMIRQSVAKMTHHGLKFRVIDSDMPEYPKNANGEDCLMVESVDAKSPAALVGVQPGDVLIESNGFPIHTSLDFTCSLIGLGLSDVAKLQFDRQGQDLEATLAFSELANENGSLVTLDPSEKIARRKVADEQDDQSDRYHSASTSNVFAQAVHETANPDEDLDASNSQRSRAAQVVWKTFGLEVEPADVDEYLERYPHLRSIAIGDFSFVLSGGVRVVNATRDCSLTPGDVEFQPGDIIFGFGVGDDKEGQLSITSLDNLYYVALSLDEFSKVDAGLARFYLIRSGRPYFLVVDMNQAL